MKTADRQRLEAEAKRLADVMGCEPDEVMELAKAGFEMLDTDPHYRLVVSASSREKQGKTHFSLATAPEPIALINLDLGTEGVVEKFPNRKIITTRVVTRQERILAGEKYTQEDAIGDWGKILACARVVVNTKVIRTLVVDTGTDCWEVCRLAKLGKLKEVMPHEYSDANAEYRAFIQMVYMRNDLNAVFTHKVKKEWKGTEYERQGFKEMGFLAQVNIEHFRVDEDDDENQPFGIRVTDARQNADLLGEELIGSMATFVNLGRLVHPGSKKDDWV